MFRTLPKNFLLCLALTTITFCTFLPSLFNNFTNWDDPLFILQNELVRDLSWMGIVKIFSNISDAGYIPITILSFTLEHHFFGFTPFYYHLTNVILHLFNVLFVFWFMRLIEPRTIVVFLTTLLFAIHPLRVESVAWVTERKDLLFCFFYLLGMISYTRAILTNPQSKPNFLTTWTLFALAMISKPQALSFPFVLLAIDYLLQRKNLRMLLIEKIPFFALLAVFVLINYSALRPESHDQAFTGMYSVLERLILINYSFVLYLAKSIVPLNLSCLYPYPERVNQTFPPIVYLSILINLTLIALCAILFRTHRKIIFAISFFCLTIGVTFLTIWYEGYFSQDHFSYLFHIGFFYALILVVLEFRKNKTLSPLIDRWKTPMVIIFTCFLIILSISRCLVWKNGITLWGDAIDKHPSAVLAYYNRGSAYMKMAIVEPAIQDFKKTIELDPQHNDAHFNLGLIYTDLGHHELAIEKFSKAISIKPDLAESYNNRATNYFHLGKYEECLADLTKALMIDHDNLKFLKNRATCFIQLKRYNDASNDLNTVLKYDPMDAEAKSLTTKISNGLTP